MILPPTLIAQNADDAMKILTARELTIGGILLGFCIYLGVVIWYLRKDIKEKDSQIALLQDKRVDEKEDSLKRFEGMANAHLTHGQNIIDFVKNHGK